MSIKCGGQSKSEQFLQQKRRDWDTGLSAWEPCQTKLALVLIPAMLMEDGGDHLSRESEKFTANDQSSFCFYTDRQGLELLLLETNKYPWISSETLKSTTKCFIINILNGLYFRLWLNTLRNCPGRYFYRNLCNTIILYHMPDFVIQDELNYVSKFWICLSKNLEIPQLFSLLLTFTIYHHLFLCLWAFVCVCVVCVCCLIDRTWAVTNIRQFFYHWVERTVQVKSVP